MAELDYNCSADSDTTDGDDNQVRSNASCIDVSGSSLSFVSWNVDGLLSELDNPDFVSNMFGFDFICLVETFVGNFQSYLFPTHAFFESPALKLSVQGRRSGGVVAMIRKELLPFAHPVRCQYENMLQFRTDKCCF